MFKILPTLFFTLFLLSSCVTTSCVLPVDRNQSLSRVLPMQSFVKVERVATVKICNPLNKNECISKKVGSSGSAFVIKNDSEGSYIMTAAHVCDVEDMKFALTMAGGQDIKFSFTLIDLEGIKYSADVVALDHANDMCIAYSYSLGRPPVKISYYAPRLGDLAYNTAAPVGVFDVNTLPIFSGYYSGEKFGMSMYTIPAIGGSSGSPVFNQNGELIGMIHSVHMRFHHLSISPTHRQISEFIRLNTNRPK